MRVLLAVGEPNMSAILKGHLANSGFDVIDQEVLHRKYLDEIMKYEKPSILIIHDYYLESDFETPEERDKEILRMIDQWRMNYESSLRVVFLCEREKTDPLLGALVARNVMDIFFQRSIPTKLFVQQLSEPPKYSNVAKLGVTDIDLGEVETEEEHVSVEKELEEEEVEKTKPQRLKDSRTSQKGVKEKKNSKMGQTKEHALKTQIQIQLHTPSKVEIEKVGYAVDRKIVVVVSPYERTGSTFVAHQLAYQVAKYKVGVTYFENPFKRPYTFDNLGGHLQVPSYQSLYVEQEKISSQTSPVRKWEVDGVSIQALNPILDMPFEESDISLEHFLKMFLLSGDTPILIVDIGADCHRPIYDELIKLASEIIVVMDCDLSNMEWFNQNQISPDFNWIHRVLTDQRTSLVANRFIKKAKVILPLEEAILIPTINTEWVYNANLKGTFAWESKEATKLQNTLFKELVQRVLPAPFLKRNKATLHLNQWLPKVSVMKKKL